MFTLGHKDILNLPIEASRLWVRIANQSFLENKDENKAMLTAWSVIKGAGYKQRGKEWFKEASIMLKKNLESKLNKLKEHKESIRHKGIIQEAEKMLKEGAKDDEISVLISKVDKATTHCIELEKKTKESAEISDISEMFTISLKEADFNDETKSATITIIECGFNASKKRYYTENALQTGYPMFSDLKMYRNHLTEAEEKSLNGMPRKIEDWMSTTRQTWYDGTTKRMKGVCEFTTEENYKFAKNNKKDIGLSINGSGVVVNGMMEGFKTGIVKEFSNAKSIDWVTEAGAGGKIDIIEAKKEDEGVKIEEITLDMLKENRPDLFKEIGELKIKEMKEESKMDEKEAKELKEANEKLVKENETLKAEKTAIKESELKTQIQAKLVECFKNVTDIPEKSINKLKEGFKNLNCKLEEVEGIVKESAKNEREYLISLKADGSSIVGLGESKEPKKEDKADSLKESRVAKYKAQGFSDEYIKKLEEIK